MAEQASWPDFAAHLLRISRNEICGKMKDFIFGDWREACTLPPNHAGEHNWPVTEEVPSE